MNDFINYLSNLNILLFRSINHSLGQMGFNKIADIFHEFLGPYAFHYHLLLILLSMLFLLYKKKNNMEEFKKTLALNTATMLTLFFSLIVGLLIVNYLLKGFIQAKRPICIFSDIYYLPEVKESSSCFRSFPSGHVTFIVVLATSMWNYFNNFCKVSAVILVTVMSITRISSGAHFPADVLGAIITTIPITIYIRNKCSQITNSYIKHWSIYQKLEEQILKIFKMLPS